jgi:predicted lipoprotein with Yx(FWY)xxD motif
MVALRFMSSHRRFAVALIAGAALALVAASASAGLVSSLGVAKRTIAGKQTSIVVDRRGDTVYELGGESLGKLKCVTAQCLKIWTPVLVRSAGVNIPLHAGVPGTLSILQRVKAKLYQVMLDRHPIYFYSGDTKIGAVRGQGIKSFGGTWHVVKAS